MTVPSDSTVHPSTWRTARLDALCRIRSGGTPPKANPSFWNGDVPWVSGKDLKRPRLVDSIDHITIEAARTYSEIAPAGSVLALVRGMGLANGFAVSVIERPMAFNQDLKALIPNEGVSGAYLVHALTYASNQVLQNVTEAAHGTKRLSQDDLNAFELNVPPEGEQLEIARILDLVVHRIAVELESAQAAHRVKATTMRELFTRGPSRSVCTQSEIGPIPEGWSAIPLGDLGRIGNGSTPKRGNPDYWVGGTFPWLNSAKVYDREIISADQFVTLVALEGCHLPKLKPGTVLVAITGQGKTLGHCAVLRIEATINQHIAYVAVDQNRAEPSFVRGYLETQYAQLRQVAGGGGSTKGALTCAFLKKLKVPIPHPDSPIESLREQREVAAILDAIDLKLDIHRRRRLVLERLFQSLLHKLMAGEIRVGALDLSALEMPAAAQKAWKNEGDVRLGEPYRAHQGHPTASA